MLPGPTNVPQRVIQAMVRPIINHRGPEFRELYARLIENSKRVFETKGDLIILSASGTGGVEAAVTNITAPGDEVIVPVMGTFSGRVSDMVNRFGGKAIEIPIELGRSVTADQVKQALDRAKGPRAVIVVYNETSTGCTARSLREIGEVCRGRDTLFVADAISILGGDELPVDEWGVDICVTGSQKCLMAPPGLALVSVNQKAWKVIEGNRRSYYFDLLAYKKNLDEGQTPYTPALPLYYALDEALQMILEEGMEARVRRHRICAEAFYNGFTAIDFKPFAAKEFRSNVVLALTPPAGVEVPKFRALLEEKYGVVVAGGMGPIKEKIIRVGSMGMVSQREVLATIGAFEEALLNADQRIEAGAGLAEAVKSLEQLAR